MIDERLLKFICCPICQGELNFKKDIYIQCNCCGKNFPFKENIIDFKNLLTGNKLSKKKNFVDIFKYLVDPTESPFSPFIIITNLKYKKYYEDNPKNVQRSQYFFNHYFKDIDIESKSVIFDFGCGKGRISSLMGLLGFYVMGCDKYFDKCLQKIKKSLFYIHDTEDKIFIKENTIDLFIDFEVSTSFAPKILKNHFCEIMRVLKSRKYLFLCSTNSQSPFFRLFFQPYVHQRDYIIENLKNVGFKILRSNFEIFYLPFLPFAIKFDRMMRNEKKGVYFILAQKP